jgi:hypothetical protein
VAQQPNIELDPADLPRRGLDPSPARRWSGKDKPGVITSPGQMPSGGAFGTPGPDTGYALRIIHHIAPQQDPRTEQVLAALMSARSASFGRAPVREDLDVAKLLCGMGEGLPLQLSARARKWINAVPHEKSKGRTAVAAVTVEQLKMKPNELRQDLVVGL